MNMENETTIYGIDCYIGESTHSTIGVFSTMDKAKKAIEDIASGYSHLKNAGLVDIDIDSNSLYIMGTNTNDEFGIAYHIFVRYLNAF